MPCTVHNRPVVISAHYWLQTDGADTLSICYHYYDALFWIFDQIRMQHA